MRLIKIVAFVAAFALLSGGGYKAADTLKTPSAGAAPAAQRVSSDWTHLGGDPLFPGGLYALARQRHSNLRQAFVFAMTSHRGQTALTFAGLSNTERRAVTRAVRMGKFYACKLHYGERFDQMSFGINGTAVDQNVTFLDPRYRNHPANAFCVDVRIGGKHGFVDHLKVPYICVNIALKNRTFLPPVTIVRKPRKKPGPVKLFIRKQAFSSAINEEQLIFPTPTNVFRFKVQCGLHGKPRYIVYQSDPQPAGTCPVSAGRARFWELSTLGPDKWEFLSPVYQTFKLKGKRFVQAVYKDKQVRESQTTTTSQTVTNVVTQTVTNTVTQTTTTSTTTPAPKNGNEGAGSGSGGPAPGPGAGGTGNPPNQTGQICYTSDGSVGQIDTSGNCVPSTPTTQSTTTSSTPPPPPTTTTTTQQPPGPDNPASCWNGSAWVYGQRDQAGWCM